MKGRPRIRDIGQLLRLWKRVAAIRQDLQADLESAQRHHEESLSSIAEFTRADAAHAVREFVAGDVRQARQSLAEFDAELARHLERTEPPWDLPRRFLIRKRVAPPPADAERKAAFKAALDGLMPVLKAHKAQIKALGYGMEKASRARVPRVTLPTPEEYPAGYPKPSLVAPASLALMAARSVHRRHTRDTPKRTRLGSQPTLSTMAGVLRHILMTDRVGEVLFTGLEDRGVSVRDVAAEILGAIVGLSASGVRKVVRGGG